MRLKVTAIYAGLAAAEPSPREAVGRVGDVSDANEPGWGVVQRMLLPPTPDLSPPPRPRRRRA